MKTQMWATVGIVIAVILLIIAVSTLLVWFGVPMPASVTVMLLFGMAVGHLASAIISEVWS